MLPLADTTAIDSTPFFGLGNTLSGTMPAWASAVSARISPDIYETADSSYNYLFFSNNQASDGELRIGYAFSTTGVNANSINLGGAVGGETDPFIFEESNGKTYL